MKMLSLPQPWAQLVVEGHKKFETRSWSTAYRGMIGIHASKNFPRWAKRLLCENGPFNDALNRPPEEIDCGAIVGVAELVSVRSTWMDEPSLLSPESAFGNWEAHRFAWKMVNPVKFWKPIPAKGALGLWTPSPELEQAILAQAEQREGEA